MKFSLVSDLHVDFPQPKIPYDKLEEIVVVAGDTSNGLEGLKVLQKLKDKGHKVYAVDGNHEHYRNLSQSRTERETTARFREDHKRCDDDFPIILVNGWYNVTDELRWLGYMNDGRMTTLTAYDVNTLAYEDYKVVAQKLREWKEQQRKGVVVTHTAPCLDTLNPRFEGHYSNDWYWNPMMKTLMEEFQDQILVWCHGHTHAPADKLVGGVRVVCNPRGYPGENPNWGPLTIEV